MLGAKGHFRRLTALHRYEQKYDAKHHLYSDSEGFPIFSNYVHRTSLLRRLIPLLFLPLIWEEANAFLASLHHTFYPHSLAISSTASQISAK